MMTPTALIRALYMSGGMNKAFVTRVMENAFSVKVASVYLSVITGGNLDDSSTCTILSA